MQTMPVSHVVYSSVTVRQNILAIIPVYNLGRGSVNHYEVVVRQLSYYVDNPNWSLSHYK